MDPSGGVLMRGEYCIFLNKKCMECLLVLPTTSELAVSSEGRYNILEQKSLSVTSEEELIAGRAK